jgi:hypothetical protein
VQDVDAHLIAYLLGLYSSSVFINASTNTEFEGNLSNYVEDHAGMIALIALIVAVIIFIIERVLEWLSRKKENKEIRRRSCNAILEEIKDNRDTFTNPDYQDDYLIYDPGKKFSTRSLNSAAFESVLHSGLFTRFETETQNSLSNLYLRIKLRNEYIIHLNGFYDTFFLYDRSPKRQELWQQVVRRYGELLTLYESQINVFLDGVETLI